MTCQGMKKALKRIAKEVNSKKTKLDNTSHNYVYSNYYDDMELSLVDNILYLYEINREKGYAKLIKFYDISDIIKIIYHNYKIVIYEKNDKFSISF